MKDLQTGLNILFNVTQKWWNFLTSDSVPLVIRMLVLAPFMLAILSLIFSVFGGSLSGKTDI